MNNPLISIIVPVYNAEKYLHRCLDSIVAQTFTNWECFLVDDGSKDSSGAICDEYSTRDNRFRVFHKENGGVSSARQFGMERMLESDSKYTIHADPDDWVEPNMLECLYQKAEESGADMVICDFYKNTSKRQFLKKQDPESENPHEVLNALYGGLHGSLWNKLIRSACYKEANIRFPQGLNYCEDFFVNVCLLLRSVSKVAYLPKAFYHYDQYMNSNAETKKTDKENFRKTRIGIVSQVRSVVSEDKRDWHYYLFEIGNAYSLLTKSNINCVEYRSYFSEVPFSVLLHSHEKYRQSLWVIMTVRCHVPLCFARYDKRTERQFKNFFKKIIGRKI